LDVDSRQKEVKKKSAREQRMTKGVVREDRERERASALINEGSKQEQIRHHNSLLSIIVTFFHTTPQSTLRSDTLEADALVTGFSFFFFFFFRNFVI
jgi:hypothetical protein